MRNLEEQRVRVAELSGREAVLAREVEEKEGRVAELEALLGEVSKELDAPLFCSDLYNKTWQSPEIGTNCHIIFHVRKINFVRY